MRILRLSKVSPQSRQSKLVHHMGPVAGRVSSIATRVTMRKARTKALMALLLLTAVSTAVFVARDRRAAQAATQTGPEHVLSFAYYSIKGDWDSTLTLNNSSVGELAAIVTLYSLDGEALKVPAITVQPLSNIAVSLSELIVRADNRGQFLEGSLDLRFNSTDSMALAPQLTVADANHGLSFDMEPPMMLMSSTLEGLWWSLDKETSGEVMLSNTTDRNLDVLLNVEWRGNVIPSSPLGLAAHQTAVLEIEKLLKDLNIKAEGIERGGLSISHNGLPGALIAHGVIQNKDARFASNLPFVDPSLQKNSVLNGTGLLLGRPASGTALRDRSFFTPRLALKNALSTSQTAIITVNYTTDGVLHTRRLSPVSLAPHEVRMADLSVLMSEVRNKPVSAAGVKIESTGAPGSLVAALSSVEGSQNTDGSQKNGEPLNIEVDVPLVSRSERSGEGGNHPFRLGKSFRSVAYLTNITQKPTKVAVIIFHEAGMFTPELISVGAGGTVAIDLLELRDSQAKDIQDRTLPVSLTEGQFFWHPHQAEALIGRVVVLDKASGTASNFSCPNCCQLEPNGLVFTPAPVPGVVGGFCQLTVNAYETYCGQFTVGPYNYTNSVAYSSSNTSVMTVNSTGMVSCVGWGTATVTASLDYYHSDFTSSEDCGLFFATLIATNPVVVVQVTFQKSDGSALPNPLRVGISATTLGGVAHNRTQHLRAVITPAAQAANVTITSNNKLTVTQGSTSNGVINFDVVGKNQSGSHGDGTIKANHSGMVIGTAAVDVLVPNNVSATHDLVGGGPAILNIAEWAGSSPAFLGLAPNQRRLVTFYGRFLNITVCDQFGGLIGDLYLGAEISELIGGTPVSINQTLQSNSKYADPVGAELPNQTIGPNGVTSNASAISAWPTAALIPFPNGSAKSDPQSVQVRVDGFILNPSIANRTVTIAGNGVSTSSPPVTITITWP